MIKMEIRKEYWLIQDNQRLTTSKYKTVISALSHQDLQLIKNLIRTNLNPNYLIANSYSLLQIAAWFTNPTIIEFLVASGADINYQNNQGNAVLVFAIRKKENFKSLLKLGANPYLKNSKKETTIDLLLKNLTDNEDIQSYLTEDYKQ